MALVIATLVALAPAWHRPESGFDEGFALAYGVRVLDGDLPHRDFVSFYGPANPFLVAGAFEIGGVSQASERVLGMLYRILIVLGAAGLALMSGRVAALTVGMASIVLILPLGVPAFAGPGALGCALCALALLLAARRARESAGAKLAVGAGLLAGLTALIRPDFGVAVLLAAIPLLKGAQRPVLRGAMIGLTPAIAAGAIDLALVGPDRAARAFRDLRASGSGRRLPFDPFSDTAAHADASRILVMIVLVAVCALAVSVWRHQRDRERGSRPVAALALLSLCLIPYALSRLDYTHAVMPLVPAVAALATAATLAAEPVRHRVRHLATPVTAAALVTAALLLAPLLLQSFAREYGGRLLGRIPAAAWVATGVDGRTFGLSGTQARDVQRIVDAAEREHERGAGTLFVGPRDLRRNYQNDTFIYYLLADYEPASYYLELNPWTANRPGSGLADELRRADVVILNRQWDVVDEPNDAARYGSSAPNRVVATRFCRLRREGTFELLRRCR